VISSLGRLRRLTLNLLNEGQGLLGLGPSWILLASGEQAILLVLCEPGPLESLPAINPKVTVDVVLLGGTIRALDPLRAQHEWLDGSQVFLHEVDAQGVLSTGSRDRIGLKAALERVEAMPELEAEDFQACIAPHIEVAKRREEEQLSFRKVFGSRQPRVTYGLLGLIAVFFVMELLWGGATTSPTLARLGALMGPSVREGEWWRLLSCTFLHGGWIHLAFNGYVLYALGASLERIIGSERFVVLYVLAGLGGSLASVLFMDNALSVGASGAIWGLLAAQGVMAYRPAGLLPEVILPGLKKAAQINLVLNVLVSFREGVDWAAHLGGGLVGAALVFSGALTLGLPRLAEVTATATVLDKKPAWLKPVAAVLGVLLLCSGALAVKKGEAWRLKEDPTLEWRALGASGLEMELPRGLVLRAKEPSDPSSPGVYAFGDLHQDASAFEVLTMRFEPPLATDRLALEFEGLKAAFQQGLPEGAVRVSGPKAYDLPQGRLLVSAFLFKNGLYMERAALLAPQELCKVDAFVRPEFYFGVYQGIARRTAATCARAGERRVQTRRRKLP